MAEKNKENEMDEEQIAKLFAKFVKENPKALSGMDMDMNDLIQNVAKSKMLEAFQPKQSGLDIDTLTKAIERTKGTGLDPTMMMMFMMMNQNNHSTTPPWPYPPPEYGQQKSSGFNLQDILQYKMMNQMLKEDGSSFEDLMKFMTFMNSGKESDMAKFLEYQRTKDEKDRDDKTQRSVESLREDMRRSLQAIQNPQNTSDPLYIIKQYQSLKGMLDEIYQYATPEQQKQFPKEGEEWTADDVVTLAQKIIGTVPTLATAVGAVRGERRSRPPKKEMTSEDRPLPTDHVRGELPDDIDQFFKSWRGPPNTAMTDPNGTRYENLDAPGTYYTKAEMVEYAKKDPEGMRQLISASQRRKQQEETQHRETARKEQKQQEPQLKPLAPPPRKSPAEPQEPHEENPYYEPEPEPTDGYNENEVSEQSTQTEQEPPVDPDSLNEAQNYGEEPEEAGDGESQEQ